MSTQNVGTNVGTNLKRSAEKLVSEKLASAKFVQAKLAPKNLKPLIKEIPVRIVERADQVLLGLSHTKQAIPTLLKQTLTRIEGNPNDLVGRVGRNVLERAESVRKQLIEKAEDSESRLNKRWVPDWLKDVSFVASPGATAPGEEAPLVETKTGAAAPEATVEAASAAVAEEQLEMKLESKSAKTKKAKSAKTASAKKPAAKKARAKKA